MQRFSSNFGFWILLGGLLGSVSTGSAAAVDVAIESCEDGLRVRVAGELAATVPLTSQRAIRALFREMGYRPAQIPDPHRDVRRAFLALSPEQRVIVALGFGLDGKGRRDADAIAALLGNRRPPYITHYAADAATVLRALRAYWPLPEESDPALAGSVYDLDLPLRTATALAADGFYTIGILTRTFASDLEQVPRLGDTGRAYLVEALRLRGLSLASGMVPPGIAAVARLSPDEVRNRPFDDLGLSFRAWRASRNLGVRTIGDMSERSVAEITALPGIGQGTAEEIRAALAAVSLPFRT